MSNEKPQRADFMTSEQVKAMGQQPRTHANCLKATGVRRPGKTAKDRSLRGDS